jgi:sulfur-oxidizing protein SoxA
VIVPTQILQILLTALLVAGVPTAMSQQSPELPQQASVSGYVFLNPQTQALQDDEFANPGYLWVTKGARAYGEAVGAGACVGCHGQDGMVGVATRYPRFDPKAGTLLNLEGRINRCRTEHQQLPALALESEPLLALSSFVTEQSKGMATQVQIDGAAEPWFQQGQDYFFQRRGQLNLACHQCHDESWGKKLRGDRISQGQPNGFPAYRLEWQTLGSLHRRLQDCESGVRAQPQALGSAAYLGLELYLVWRSQGLALESPGVRR